MAKNKHLVNMFSLKKKKKAVRLIRKKCYFSDTYVAHILNDMCFSYMHFGFFL